MSSSPYHSTPHFDSSREASFRPRREAGFTLAEAMIVVAILAIATAMALPAMGRWASNQRLRDMAGTVGSGFSLARSKALQTGNIHLVFFGQDALGNVLTDPSGVEVDMLVVDDGQPGSANQNCLVDANEALVGHSLAFDLTPGATTATGKVSSDGGAGAVSDGATFSDAGGAPALWVMFRPDGTTRAFSNDCSTGGIGSGVGAVYLTNGERDVVTVLSPLGATRVHSWQDSTGAWSN